jgi:predicted RNA-binding protein Jag
MSCELIKTIRKQTEVLFYNANIMLQTCNLNFMLCDMPVWKHVYHALHSCDQWYINPKHFSEPDFHESNLNSLDIKSDKVLSREDLFQYLEKIHIKILAYLDSLTDDMLYEIPLDCKENRLTLILSQFRHFYAHLGNINATTIIETNEWPRVIGTSGRSGASTEGFYE